MMRAVIMVSGSGTNLQAIIDANIPQLEIAAVVSDSRAAYGLERARNAGIPAIVVDYKSFAARSDFDKALFETLQQIDPELIVLAGFMRILDADVVNHYDGRMLNVHPSLLPDYPGLHTHQRVIDARERWHGTTVHYVIPELDAGPAVMQYRIEISAEDTAETLGTRIQQGEYRIYPEAIGLIAAGQLELRNGVVFKDGKQLEQPVLVEETGSSNSNETDS